MCAAHQAHCCSISSSPRERESQSIKLPTLVNKLQSGTRPKRLYLQGPPSCLASELSLCVPFFLYFFGGVPTHFESAFLGLCICLPCCGCRVVGAIFYLFAKANLSQASKAERLKKKLLFRIEFQFVPRVFPHKNARIRNRDRWDIGIGNRIRNGVTQGAVSLNSSVSPSLLSSQIFYR